MVASTVAPALQSSAPAAAADGPEAMLQQLENLHAQGILSDEEYQAKRQEVMARSGQGPSIPEMIKQLADLRDQGILSEDEFAAKKEDLLSRL